MHSRPDSVNDGPHASGVNDGTHPDGVYWLIRPVHEFPSTASMLAGLPEWRRRQALSYVRDSDRRQCAAAYLLLVELLERLGIDYDGQPFALSPRGKPSLAGHPGTGISISHCDRAVMAAVALTGSVGCDIETVPEVPDYDVCRLVFGPREADRVARSEAPSATFAAMWTEREALAKMLDADLTDVGQPLPADASCQRGTALGCAWCVVTMPW